MLTMQMFDESSIHAACLLAEVQISSPRPHLDAALLIVPSRHVTEPTAITLETNLPSQTYDSTCSMSLMPISLAMPSMQYPKTRIPP